MAQKTQIGAIKFEEYFKNGQSINYVTRTSIAGKTSRNGVVPAMSVIPEIEESGYGMDFYGGKKIFIYEKKVFDVICITGSQRRDPDHAGY